MVLLSYIVPPAQEAGSFVPPSARPCAGGLAGRERRPFGDFRLTLVALAIRSAHVLLFQV